MPSRCVATSTWFSTTRGPEVWNSSLLVADGVLGAEDSLAGAAAFARVGSLLVQAVSPPHRPATRMIANLLLKPQPPTNRTSTRASTTSTSLRHGRKRIRQ